MRRPLSRAVSPARSPLTPRPPRPAFRAPPALAVLVSLALLAAACSGDGPAGTGPGPEARAVTSEDGLVTVEIPAGVDADVTVTELAEPPEELAAFELRGAIHDLGPAGATFEEPVIVTRLVDPETIEADLETAIPVIGLVTEADGEWRYLDDQTLRLEDGMIAVTGTTDHFSPLVAVTTGAEISREAIESLPVGRDFTALVSLQPGVTGASVADGAITAQPPIGVSRPLLKPEAFSALLACDAEGPADLDLEVVVGGIKVEPLIDALGLAGALTVTYREEAKVVCAPEPLISWEELDAILLQMGATTAITDQILPEIREDPEGDQAATFGDLSLDAKPFTDIGLSVMLAWDPTREALALLGEAAATGTLEEGIEVLELGGPLTRDRAPFFFGCLRTREAVPWSPAADLGTIELGVRAGGFGAPAHDASEQDGWPVFDGASVILGGRVGPGAGPFLDIYDPAVGWYTPSGEPLVVVVTDAPGGDATTYCAITPADAVGGDGAEIGFFVNQVDFAGGTSSTDFVEPREFRFTVGFRF